MDRMDTDHSSLVPGVLVHLRQALVAGFIGVSVFRIDVYKPLN